jgi:hypothetical protein
MVEFASDEQGMENSGRPETGEFAAFLAGISDGALTFRNLDVLREEDLWRCHGARAPSTPTLAGRPGRTTSCSGAASSARPGAWRGKVSFRPLPPGSSRIP